MTPMMVVVIVKGKSRVILVTLVKLRAPHGGKGGSLLVENRTAEPGNRNGPPRGRRRGRGKKEVKQREVVNGQGLGQRRGGGDLVPGGSGNVPDQGRNLLTPGRGLTPEGDTRSTRSTEKSREVDHDLKR